MVQNQDYLWSKSADCRKHLKGETFICSTHRKYNVENVHDRELLENVLAIYVIKSVQYFIHSVTLKTAPFG